jgi:hypothetical protein
VNFPLSALSFEFYVESRALRVPKLVESSGFPEENLDPYPKGQKSKARGD